MIKSLNKTFLLTAVSLFLLATRANAQTTVPSPIDRLQNTAGAANLSTTNVNPQSIIVSVIVIVLGLLGLTFLVLMLYAGFMWMTSAGNEEKVTKAKETITNSTIGIAIIIFSYALVTFIAKMLIRSTENRFLE
jgi:heme/copper-type cytochrome/quinol oxidase subunit 2